MIEGQTSVCDDLSPFGAEDPEMLIKEESQFYLAEFAISVHSTVLWCPKQAPMHCISRDQCSSSYMNETLDHIPSSCIAMVYVVNALLLKCWSDAR